MCYLVQATRTCGLFSYGLTMGVPAVLLERGGCGLWNTDEAKRMAEDVKNILRYAGLLRDGIEPVSYKPVNIARRTISRPRSAVAGILPFHRETVLPKARIWGKSGIYLEMFCRQYMRRCLAFCYIRRSLLRSERRNRWQRMPSCDMALLCVKMRKIKKRYPPQGLPFPIMV